VRDHIRTHPVLCGLIALTSTMALAVAAIFGWGYFASP
jgi:hypothetical protein